jgi:hypothetical protein
MSFSAIVPSTLFAVSRVSGLSMAVYYVITTLELCLVYKNDSTPKSTCINKTSDTSLIISGGLLIAESTVLGTLIIQRRVTPHGPHCFYTQSGALLLERIDCCESP